MATIEWLASLLAKNQYCKQHFSCLQY